MVNNNNNNGNGTSVVGMAADIVEGFRESLFDPEGALSDVNMLGMERPLATINFLGPLAEQGGIFQSLRTGVKRQTQARKGGRTGGRQTYRPPPRQPANAPPTPRISQLLDQPQEQEIIL